jgi:hypothetical protein
MKYLKLFENNDDKIIYTKDDCVKFIINIMNDIYEGLVNETLIESDPNTKLETYKQCQDFFINLHNGDDSNYKFDIGRYTLEENIDDLETHKLKKTTDKYNL